ncbi:MAG TPA: hypothetical protein VIM63_08530 [Rhodoferax sp.]
MSTVTTSEVVRNFSKVAARVAAGEDLTVTRYGKPVLKLVQLAGPALSASDRAARVTQALSFRMTALYGKTFVRSDAYEA